MFENANAKKNVKLFFSIIIGFLVLISCFLISGCASSDYKPQLKDPQITSPDILQDGVLKVGVDFDNPPLAGETSKSAGIDIDVASAIADQLGLKVEFSDIGTSAELAISNKKVDMVMGLSKAATSDEMWKSESYIPTACCLFAADKNSVVPTKDGQDKISTQLASGSALVAQNQFSVSNIKLESSLSACFESLRKGEVKYVATDAVIGTYTANNSEVNADIVALMSKPSGYCIGLSDSNKNLQQKIASIVESLSKDGTFDAISSKWIGKKLDFTNIATTAEANNQADADELDNGVYSEVAGTKKSS